jgi:hypothetical protein
VQEEPEILLTGLAFVSQSVVYCNEEPCPTVFVDSRHLSIALPSRFLGNAKTLHFKVGNPSPGGGISEELGFEIRNPKPKILSITPAILDAGWRSQSITIKGHHFVPTSSILFNGQQCAANYLDAEILLFELGPRELTQAGIHAIGVKNPSPGGGESETFDLILNHPHPEISYLLPSSCEVGAKKIELAVHGTKFASEARILINGEERSTQRINPTELRTLLEKKDLHMSGELQVQVGNPEPTCGLSNGFKFTVLNPVPHVEMIEVDESANRDERLLITVHGTNFNSQTRVYLEDSLVESDYRAPNTLLVSVPDRLLGGQNLMLLAVENPGPGGGRTSGASLMLNQSEAQQSNSPAGLTDKVADLSLNESDVVVLDFLST